MTLLVAFVALYGAGITSTLSPCVLPLVPAYIGVLTDGNASAGRLTRVGVFAVGVVVTFAVLGMLAGLAGRAIGSVVPAVQRLAGVLLLVLAVFMVLAAIGWLGNGVRLLRVLPYQVHVRALLLGVGCAIAWSPCVGPLLGAALTAAAGGGSHWRATALLVAFAGGVLTPFVAAASLRVRQIPRALRALGARLQWLSAAAMIGLGVLLAGGWYDDVVQRWAIGT